MRTLAAILFLAFCAGCSSRKPVDNNVAVADSTALVQDAVSVMLTVYPPAKVRLALVQDTDDPFGTALIETMRAYGYAVAAYDKPINGDKYLAAVKRPDGMAFAYLLDDGGSKDELQVHLHIGSETLNRLYAVKTQGEATQYIPQGFWTRRESGAGGMEQAP